MNMIANPTTFVGKSRVLSAVEVAAFGARVEQIRAELVASIGEEDAKYIYRVRDFVRYSEIASRAMLMFGGWLPPVWLFATGLLGVSKIVENMELAHNVMHGQYDWMNDKSLHSANYDWDTVCSSEDWKQTHNFAHHTYTNIVGRDHDVGYGLLRMSDKQKWEPRFLINLPAAVFLMLTFQWTLALQNLKLEELVYGKVSFKTIVQRARFFRKKATRQALKDYVFFPLIAGPMALPVLLGNATANLIRNIWAFSIIFCGHFTADAEMFEDNLATETRAEWYLRQLKGSSNLTGGSLMHFMSGNLSHQIEHHMFPELPASRYKEAAPKIKALCDEYQQHYNTGAFSTQFSQVIKRVAVHSLPNKTVDSMRDMTNKLKGMLPFGKRKLA